MSWYHLVITIFGEIALSGNIGGFVDPIYFKLGDGVYLVSFTYTLSPTDLGKDYELTVEIYADGKRVLLESEKKKVPKDAVYIVDGHEVVAKPGEYDVIFRVRSGGRESHAKFPIKIEEYDKLNLSSLVLVSQFYDDPSNAPFRRGEVGFLPNPSASFKDTLRYFFEIYDLEPGASKLSVRWYIHSGNELVAQGTPRIIPVDLSSMYYKGSIPLASLDNGRYRITFEVVDIGLGLKRTISKDFRINRTAIALDDDIRYFIDYIASAEELKEFKSILDPERKKEWIEKFWAKKDPMGTFYPVFRQRVLEADAKFSNPFKKGRYTDMGKVYILFGMPDEIKREEISVSGKAYQIWVYYSDNLKFIFFDPFNTGEYKLMASNVPGFGTYVQDIDQYFDFYIGY